MRLHGSNGLGGVPRFAGVIGLAFLLATLATSAFATATIQIINIDGPGVGFNDPTPAAPVGGNPGTTVGQQRLNVFQQAATVWGSILTSSVTIQCRATFTPLTCTATSAVLGSCGPRFVEEGTPGLEFPTYWYHEALACKEAGFDLTPPGDPSLPPGDDGSDMMAQFNSNLGQSGCLTGSGWYYGLDHNHGTLIDLLVVVTHEFAHGLGFSTTTSGTTGAYLNGPPSLPGLWDKFLFDETQNLRWDQNTAAQRVSSSINTGHLVWNGQQMNFEAPRYLSHAPELAVPFGSGTLPGNTATFGAALTLGGVTAQAILAVDAVAPVNDACDAITNGAQLSGKIAVVDRGTCTFTSKVKNVQNSGAIGCVLVNNVAGSFAPSGTDSTITIPVIALSQADGTSLKTAIAGGPITVTIQLSPTQIAGLSTGGHIEMYAPNPFQSGSSVNHFDVSCTPNLLMEPAINPDLTGTIDLTDALFRDIGWLPRLLAVPDGGGPPARVGLANNPNPARGATDIRFDLAAEESVELTIYDVSGRAVRSLSKGNLSAGPHTFHWDGLDAAGRQVAAGVYLARLKGTHTQATHSLVWMN
jgi:hypothetical protein